MNDVLEIALAGCLHDVGKLFQRAGTGLTDPARRMEPMLCPTDEAGYGTHRHVLWTNDFIERYLAWLPPSVDRARLNDIASSHHRPSEPLHWLVAEADRLASGHDRRPAEQESDGGYCHVPLSSILAGLALQRGPVAAPPWYGPAHDLSVCVSPRSDVPPPDLRPEYARVADAMIADMATWPRVPEAVLCGCLASLSARYLAMNPASTVDMPDTSLHDHNMLVAAFAAALFQYHKRTDSLREPAIRDRASRKFRLVCGDLSGIQKFIFAPAPEGLRKGIARTFRARSFYLSML
ncbi:MAG: type III-A CRISPR-associated protein Cas10/Csm1, partial [Phycisphaerae bacterium]